MLSLLTLRVVYWFTALYDIQLTDRNDSKNEIALSLPSMSFLYQKPLHVLREEGMSLNLSPSVPTL
ncbi:hypothetical protein HMPREF0973_00518 [Prevotella veroralis F0319]|uniref:Uncharacterized protein n=1 Tax=Prevotella veroralis F0319 TaxID=649761 RepID=C9MLP3_9BACT|nr:hypothetical protein HMPREF0973_00518 [Prevotella veroralis F0319]